MVAVYFFIFYQKVSWKIIIVSTDCSNIRNRWKLHCFNKNSELKAVTNLRYGVRVRAVSSDCIKDAQFGPTSHFWTSSTLLKYDVIRLLPHALTLTLETNMNIETIRASHEYWDRKSFTTSCCSVEETWLNCRFSDKASNTTFTCTYCYLLVNMLLATSTGSTAVDLQDQRSSDRHQPADSCEQANSTWLWPDLLLCNAEVQGFSKYPPYSSRTFCLHYLHHILFPEYKLARRESHILFHHTSGCVL